METKKLTFINKNISIGAVFMNDSTSSLVKIFDWVGWWPTDSFFKNAISLGNLDISTFSLTINIDFTIEYFAHSVEPLNFFD